MVTLTKKTLTSALLVPTLAFALMIPRTSHAHFGHQYLFLGGAGSLAVGYLAKGRIPYLKTAGIILMVLAILIEVGPALAADTPDQGWEQMKEELQPAIKALGEEKVKAAYLQSLQGATPEELMETLAQ